MDGFTRGAASLKAFLADHDDWNQAKLAGFLGISQPSVSSWIRGVTRPEPHLREAVEILTGIPAKDWDTDGERALVDRLRAENEGGGLSVEREGEDAGEGSSPAVDRRRSEAA